MQRATFAEEAFPHRHARGAAAGVLSPEVSKPPSDGAVRARASVRIGAAARRIHAMRQARVAREQLKVERGAASPSAHAVRVDEARAVLHARRAEAERKRDATGLMRSRASVRIGAAARARLARKAAEQPATPTKSTAEVGRALLEKRLEAEQRAKRDARASVIGKAARRVAAAAAARSEAAADDVAPRPSIAERQQRRPSHSRARAPHELPSRLPRAGRCSTAGPRSPSRAAVSGRSRRRQSRSRPRR